MRVETRTGFRTYLYFDSSQNAAIEVMRDVLQALRQTDRFTESWDQKVEASYRCL